MGTITLKNVRATADITIKVRLKDGGLYVDWSVMSDVRAWIFSDDQKTIAGRCSILVDADDPSLLICEYAATKPQYRGVNRIIVQGRYDGRTKTYDKAAFNIVASTDELEDQTVTIADPVIDVEIDVEDVTSSILDAVLAACVKATAEARDVVDIHRGPAAGFGTVDAEADDNVGTPEVEVETSGDDAAKNFHFKFMNIKGETGERGPAGVESAAVSVDQSTGEASASLSIEDGVLSLALSGIKGAQGDQGNSGYSGAAGELEIVNNDTEGGETAGWSAERGKIIREDHDALALDETAVAGATSKKTTLDIDDYPIRSYSLGNDGKYGTSNTYKHTIIPCVPGNSFIVEANTTNPTYVAWFTSNASPTSGGTAPLVPGTSRMTVSAGTKQVLTAPAGANYMYVYRGTASSYPYTPTSIALVANAITVKQSYDKITAAETMGVGLFSDAVYDGPDYTSQEVDLATEPVETLAFKADNSFDSSGGHSIVLVEPDDVVKVTANDSYDVLVGFVSGIYCADSGKSVALISSATVGKGETAYVKAPSNAVGFIYNTLAGGNDTKPSAVVIYKSVPTGTTEDLDRQTSFRRIPCSRFLSSGGYIGYTAGSSTKNVLVQVKAGHRYVFAPTVNAALNGWFLTELPRIGASTTSLGLTINTDVYYTGCTLLLTPASDGYYLFRVFKSSSPQLDMTITEMPSFEQVGVSPQVDDLKAREDATAMAAMQWMRINANAETQRSRVIVQDNGKWGTATTSKHLLLPVTERQYVRITGKANGSASLAWLTSDATPTNYGVPPFVEGTTRFDVSGTAILKVPAGAKYLYVSLGAENSALPDYLALSVDYEAIPDIVRSNDYLKTRRILAQMKGTTRSEDSASYQPLMLLHFSDLHSMPKCQTRINDFRSFFADYIDDTLQTGDLMDHWGATNPYGDITDPDNPNKDIMNVIGNHDTATYSGGTYSWHAHQGADAYGRFIGPFVENWGVTQPEGAADNGYCFFYKDYTTSKVRLVVIDAWNTDTDYIAAQETWLADVLAGAITAGLSVVMASHFRLKAAELLQSTFSKPNAEVESPDSAGFNDPYVPIVKTFIDNGGELVCWLCGHAHYDAITRTSEAKGYQISVCVANAGRFGTNSSSVPITNSMIYVDFSDWQTFDLFNVVAIDTYYKLITLMRVGSHWDKYGRRIETTCIKYTTGEVIKQ